MLLSSPRFQGYLSDLVPMLYPGPVSHNVSTGIAYRFEPCNAHRPQHGLQQVNKIGPDHGVILGIHGAGISLVDITLVWVSSYNNFVGMRVLPCRLVFEIDEAGRHEDKQQNHRDH